MPLPDYARARAYVIQRLAQELPAHLTYHGIRHTIDDVLPAAERLAILENIPADELLLLRTAALFHDLGFVMRYAGHEAASVCVAEEVLPDFGYSSEQVQIVSDIIQATRLPQQPKDRLGEILADADLDVLGREDFWYWNQNLRDEHRAEGRSYTDQSWYTNQLQFLQQHTYFTASARRLRDAQKARHILQMKDLLNKGSVDTPMPSTSDLDPNAPGQAMPVTDRVTLLRSVSLFSATPDENLAEVAALLSTVNVNAGQVVFNKNDAGDSMYIIVRGHILIHDGEMAINLLGPMDVFGEMALLDNQPRTASATARERTQLLRLDQGSFYELMDHRPEVARGVIRVLNLRLRGRMRDMAQDFEYIQQVGQITAAAAALEAGMYEPAILEVVCQRVDELGQLARVFRGMANEIQARERRLKQEVQLLRIQIDEVKKAQQVAEITESEYFLQLQNKVKLLKKR